MDFDKTCEALSNEGKIYITITSQGCQTQIYWGPLQTLWTYAGGHLLFVFLFLGGEGVDGGHTNLSWGI